MKWIVVISSFKHLDKAMNILLLDFSHLHRLEYQGVKAIEERSAAKNELNNFSIWE